MKLIGRERFDNQVFVQCDCGEEILEFCREPNPDDNGAIEYFIRYHGWFDRKVDQYCSFYFADKGEFARVLDKMRSMTSNVDDPTVLIQADKYITYRGKFPGILAAFYDNDLQFFTLIKYPNPKEAGKVGKRSWEFILRREQVEELLRELEEFR